MAEGPTIALRYMKDNLDEALLFDFATARDHEAERLIRTTMTSDHREAVQAFIEKRKACSRAIEGAESAQPANETAAVSREAAAILQLAQGMSCGATSMRFSKRTSFQSPGLGVKAKPDLRASPIITSLERKVSPNSRVGAKRGGAAFQIPQQRRADALALPAVVDRHAELEARGIGLEAIAGFADDGLDSHRSS